MDNENSTPYVIPASGVHIVVDSSKCPRDYGLLHQTSDNRVLFLLPWLNSTLIGTTDSSTELTFYPKPTRKEIDFIINEVNNYLKEKISIKDVKSSWSGIRPLVKDLKAPVGNTATISREHSILVSDSHLISICGGKWTTTRKMAEDVVDILDKLSKKVIKVMKIE